MKDALISIKPIYVEKLLSGEKEVEIRNRTVNLLPGSRLWIYSTLPKACVQAVAIVSNVEIGAPASIWRQHGESLGISETEYHRYVNGSGQVSAIVMKPIWQLPCNLSLHCLRGKVPGFHPPQFLKYMNESDPLLSALVDSLLVMSGAESFQKTGIELRDLAGQKPY